MKLERGECLLEDNAVHRPCQHGRCGEMPFCPTCGVKVATVGDGENRDETAAENDVRMGESEVNPLLRLVANGYEVEIPSDGSPVIVGSDREADFRITGDPFVLPKHVCVYVDGDGLHIESFEEAAAHYTQGGIEDPYLRGGRFLVGSTFIEVR